MEIQGNMEESKDKVIVNPLLKNKFQIETDDKIIELSLGNISKYFYKLYVLTPLKNEEVDSSIFDRSINESKWKSIGFKMVLSEASIKMINNFEHNHNITIVNSSDIEQFNHFGLELHDKILVLPIFNVSFLNIQNYLKIYQGHYKLQDIYNVVVLNQIFGKDSRISYNSLIYMTDIIKNLEESNYWTRKYNCLLNISKKYNNRTFRLRNTKTIKNPEVARVINNLDKDNIENNYLTMIFNNKNFVDASSAIKKMDINFIKFLKKLKYQKKILIFYFQNLMILRNFICFLI